MLISFSFLFLFIVSILMFYTYGHDTRFLYREFALYGKEVPGKMGCMNNNSLQFHESSKEVYELTISVARTASIIWLNTLRK